MSSAAPAYDVAVIGGGLTGAAVALRLLQEAPALRVVVLDRGSGGARRPGEALPELAAHFLGRVLGLGDHLNECHYTRQGTRFWFANGDPAQPFDACSEIGPKYLARLPTYLVDRAVLEGEMLRRAEALGARIRRPVTVERVALSPGGAQTLTLVGGDELTARWAFDASGFLSRPEGVLRSVWGRWRGVTDWDSPALRRKYPQWAAAFFGMRNPALNCLMGDGWWSGWTPLRGGDVSIRLTGDPRLTELPRDAAATKQFLEERHPVARELLQSATLVEGSAGAGFIDPLYGRHLDGMVRDVLTMTESILRGDAPARIRSQVDCDKYEYLGEFDLMRVATFFDLGLYTLKTARLTYEGGAAPLGESTFARLLDRRLARIAQGRRARGGLGRSNSGRRALFTSFNFNPASGAPMIGAAARWLWLELTEGWRNP